MRKPTDESTAEGRTEGRVEGLDAILDGYLRSLEAGVRPDHAAVLARHPDLAEDLAPALVGIDLVRGGAASLAPDESPDSRAGGSLGDYRLLREVGRGGMAVVYEAEQVSLGRRIALKVLPFAAVLDPKQLQRFKNEATAAAQLRHPNIVPVYGVGCERGVHYYAMQYVEGQSLALAIRELKVGRAGEGPRTPLSSHASHREPAYVRRAASLGAQAAEALDHAHQVGIIHRDVKPGNLLVDQAGTLWVTDFGLARCGAEDGLTRTGEIVGTFRYMSPEQALAKRAPVDHRTDVYSLGATLYELLTLEPAFPGDDPHAVMRDIASRDPVPPRRLNPALPADLETVLLKAMAKDPSARYETAQQMADDLKRFLADRPVLARRPSLPARVTRWSRRHRGVLAASFAALLLAIAALVADNLRVAREQANTEAALHRANAHLALAGDAVEKFLEEAGYAEFEDQPLPSPSRRALLEKALEFRARLDASARDASPRARVGILHALHRYGEAAAILADRLEAHPRDAWARAELAHMLGHLGRGPEALKAVDDAIAIEPGSAMAHRTRGDVLRGLGEPEAALASYDRAIEIEPGFAPVHRNRAAALHALGRFDDAVAACDRAVALDPRLGGVHAMRARSLHALGRFEEAVAAYDRAIEIDAGDAGSHGGRGLALYGLDRLDDALASLDRAIRLDPRPAETHLNRSLVLFRLERFDEALAACDRALVLAPDSAEAHTQRGCVLRALGRLDEALAAHDRAIAIAPRSASAHGYRGLALHRAGRVPEALAAEDRAIELGPAYAEAYVHRGMILGRTEAAISAYDRAIALRPDLPEAHRERAATLHSLGRHAEALASVERALALRPSDARAHQRHGAVLAALGRFDEAVAALREGLRIRPDSEEMNCDLGTALFAAGDLDGALSAYREVLRLRPDSPGGLCGVGSVFLRQGRFREALQYVRKGHEEGAKRADWDLPSAEWVRITEHRVEMEDLLDAAIARKERPRDASEELELAEMLHGKRLYETAAEFQVHALSESPSLADDLVAGHRYNAACLAALAASRPGPNAPAWRRKALDWLTADLAARAKSPETTASLASWTRDPDLAAVRDRLDDLPAEEREAWRRLWAEVDAVRARGPREE